MTQDSMQLNPGPEWLAHRYDPAQDSIHFHVVDRALRRSAPFLTDEHLPQGRTPLVLQRAALPVGQAPDGQVPVGQTPVHFVFHSAYCCSTLLANGLDLPGSSMALKEPVLLNDLVGWRQRGAAPQAVSQMLDTALSLLARPFEPGEATVVKPSNVVNGLATAIMTLRPDSRALLLYAPLETYLASIARKGMTGRLWVRELLSRQLVDGLVNLGFAPRDYLLHTDLQVAAVGWLAQFHLFSIMADRWPDRVRTLNSETLTARPMDSLSATAGLFGITPPVDGFGPVVDSIFSRNAKDGTPFAEGQRSDDRDRGMALHRTEIEQVAAWARAVATSAGLPDHLPLPLIG